MLITAMLDAYIAEQPKRAAGGIYALAGFDFQLRLYLARLAEALRKGDDELDEAGRVFLEALSDIAEQHGNQLICIQAKRTLNRTKLRDAAQEVVAIDGVSGG